MALRNLVVLEMAALLVWNSAAERPAVLGVVIEADRVHLNTTAVTAGATVYDGDRFSTEIGGMLLLRSGTTMLELAEDSILSVQNSATGAQGIEAKLDQGTLVFSAARAVSLNIIARDASIRSVADTRSVAQVSVAGPKELRIYSRRGALQFSYHGETETISEGKAYRVILDPPEDDAEKKGPVKSGRHRTAFLLVAIAGGAAATGLILYENHRHKRVESPDRP